MITSDFEQQLTQWRHHLHRNPETGFNESRTSDYIATILGAMGLEVHRGIGGTGLVASLKLGNGKSSIGLRADMDALAITEAADDRLHKSLFPGCMHACGHDGHMAMVLGAARLLLERRNFNGVVRFIFQPAEEHGRGAIAMMKDGLFERFPVDEIYGVHNMPGMPAGHIATRSGPIMASEDNFVIRIAGRGGHAARPHMAVDLLLVGAQIVVALQTVVARSVDPAESAVVSCTEFITDGIRNVLPSHVTIQGDTRSYSPEIQVLLERRMREICKGVCDAHGAVCEVEYTHEFAPTVNSPNCVEVALKAACAVVGAEKVKSQVAPMMISEDFGAFLKVVPGAFVFLGNGDNGSVGDVPLHNAGYDFNDSVLSIGARYFAEIARVRLPQNAC